jgi:hypothetical protein
MQDPFPATPLSAGEQDALAGSWKVDNGEEGSGFFATYHVAFASNGVAQLAVVDFKDGQFKLARLPIHFTRTADHYYLSVPVDEEPGCNHFVFMEFRPTPQGALLWLPDKHTIGGMVEADILEGDYEDGDQKNNLILTTPANRILDLITNEYQVFNYREPILLKRL